MTPRTGRLAVSISCILGLALPATAYDVDVHATISEHAVSSSRLDETLKALGFEGGIGATFSDGVLTRRADAWVQEGAKLEDNPETRVLNHFHNPLASTWDDAGLTMLFKWGQSSILWQQHAGQEVGEGSWSWPDARQRYHDAVAFPSTMERDAQMAKLLRALGHIMHLDQDSSLPAHTRNDAHPYKTLFNHDLGNPDGYERWVDKRSPVQLATLLSEPIVRASAAIFARPGALPGNSRTDHAGAPAPIKYLIDTGQYIGANPDILTGNRIGLAEYSNGNFFSDDTVFADTPAIFGQIPFPSRASVDLGPPESTPNGQLRRYFIKVRHGETTIQDGPDAGRNYRLAVPSALYDYLPDALKESAAGLDGRVFEDYARLLLPRAVGYSAALLDYFFRGQLETEFDSNGLIIKNRTPGETMAGTFELYYDMEEGTRTQLGTWTLTLPPDGASDLLMVPPFPDNKPPASIDSYYVVFRGQLGLEADAVAATRATRMPIRGLWSVYTPMSGVNGVIVEYPSEVGPLTSLVSWWMEEGVRYSTFPAGTSLTAFLTSIYREPTDAPGRTLTLWVFGWCKGESGAVGTSYDLVELETPADFETLKSYRYASNPPKVRRILRTVETKDPFGEGETLSLDIEGIRFLGVRLRTVPDHYPSGLGDNFCDAFAMITGVE